MIGRKMDPGTLWVPAVAEGFDSGQVDQVLVAPPRLAADRPAPLPDLGVAVFAQVECDVPRLRAQRRPHAGIGKFPVGALQAPRLQIIGAPIVHQKIKTPRGELRGILRLVPKAARAAAAGEHPG